MPESLRRLLLPAISSLIFFLLGLILIPYPGLQQDELLFAVPIYARGSALYNWRLGSHRIPVMVMSYIGTIKTGIYDVVFRIWAPSVWSIRIPALLAGVLFIWLTWIWVARIAGNVAAGVTALLLATDSIFLLTNTFDWGPVALQHLLLMGGLVALERAIRRRSSVFFAVAFFLWGVGLWDKAVFIWMLSGMAVAAVCLWPRMCLRQGRGRNALVALAALAAGCCPLIVYNVAAGGATFSENSHWTASELRGKLSELQVTLDGSGMFGFFAAEHTENPKAPGTLLQRASVSMAEAAGHSQQNYTLPLLLVAVLAGVAFVRERRKLLLFCVITAAVAWLLMAAMHPGGGGAHHVVLLWPLPFVFIGVVFSGLWDKRARGTRILAVLVLVLAVFANLRTTNEYLASLIVNGPGIIWTDATFPLSRAVSSGAPVTAVDWGYSNPLLVLSGGRVRIDTTVHPSTASVLIRHTRGNEITPGSNERAFQLGRAAGLRDHVDKVIADSHGTPLFEVYHLEPSPPEL